MCIIIINKIFRSWIKRELNLTTWNGLIEINCNSSEILFFTNGQFKSAIPLPNAIRRGKVSHSSDSVAWRVLLVPAQSHTNCHFVWDNATSLAPSVFLQGMPRCLPRERITRDSGTSMWNASRSTDLSQNIIKTNVVLKKNAFFLVQKVKIFDIYVFLLPKIELK